MLCVGGTSPRLTVTPVLRHSMQFGPKAPLHIGLSMCCATILISAKPGTQAYSA